MSFTVECYTLFDITNTGVLNRHKPDMENIELWKHKRNTQCNFDTILQAISLRSQPENITIPEKKLIDLKNNEMFGFLFENDDLVPYWHFNFTVAHSSVFYDGVNELGALFTDCDGIPMIKCGSEWDKLPSFLDTSEEVRNIYFKITQYEIS